MEVKIAMEIVKFFLTLIREGIILFCGGLLALYQYKKYKRDDEISKMRLEKGNKTLFLLEESTAMCTDLISCNKNNTRNIKTKFPQIQMYLSEYGTDDDKKIFSAIVYIVNFVNVNSKHNVRNWVSTHREECYKMLCYLILLKMNIKHECFDCWDNPIYEYGIYLLDGITDENEKMCVCQPFCAEKGRVKMQKSGQRNC